MPVFTYWRGGVEAGAARAVAEQGKGTECPAVEAARKPGHKDKTPTMRRCRCMVKSRLLFFDVPAVRGGLIKMPGSVCLCPAYLVAGFGGTLPVPQLTGPPVHTPFVKRNAILPASACRRQEMGTFATPRNLLSSGRYLTSFAACNPRETCVCLHCLMPKGGVCKLGRSMMFEVIGPGYRIQASSFPGWSELGRKAPELPRNFSRREGSCPYGHRANHALRLLEYALKIIKRGLYFIEASS